MGYTMEGKNVVIWTEKQFISYAYPFHDEGENHTFFYDNLRSKKPLFECLSSLSKRGEGKVDFR